MIYTQPFIMPLSGSFRIGTIGGSALQRVGDLEYQVGYILPPRYGFVKVRSLDNKQEFFQCTADLFGYNDNKVDNVKVPCDVIIELPCSIIINGTPGLNILVEVWPIIGLNSRGAVRSFSGVQNGVVVPVWATSVDFTGTTALFRNNLGSIIGAIDLGANNNSITNFSIPMGAETVDITGSTPANTSLIFRQV